MQSGSYKNSIIAVDVSRRRLTKTVQIYTGKGYLFLFPLHYLPFQVSFSLKSWDALMDLRSHPHLSQRSFSLGCFEHFLHHLNDNFIMRKASRYKRVNFKSIALGVFGRRLNDILQNCPSPVGKPDGGGQLGAQHLCLAGDQTSADS